MSRVREEANGRVAAILDELTTGFVVFHDVPLPRPSRAVVDHVVVAPCGIWAILVRESDETVTFGEGRGADTLWAGRTPLRIEIEECESNAVVIETAIGRPVEALLCLSAPLPSDSFDFHGLRVVNAEALTSQLSVATTGLHDVGAVARRITEAFGVQPANGAELPRLGAPPPSSPASRSRRGRRRVRFPRRARRARLDRSRLLLVAAVAALIVLVDPSWVGFGTDAAQRGAAQLLSPESTLASPTPVGYTVTCAPNGDVLLDWHWPGTPPEGVDGYGIRTRQAGGAVNHTLDGWRTPSDVPPPARLGPGDVMVITEYLDASGATIAATERPLERSSLGC